MAEPFLHPSSYFCFEVHAEELCGLREQDLPTTGGGGRSWSARSILPTARTRRRSSIGPVVTTTSSIKGCTSIETSVTTFVSVTGIVVGFCSFFCCKCSLLFWIASVFAAMTKFTAIWILLAKSTGRFGWVLTSAFVLSPVFGRL